MKIRTISALAAIGFIAVGCESEASDAVIETDAQKASYAIGLQVGRSLEPAGERLDRSAFRAGMEDAIAGTDPRFPPEEMQAVMQQFAQEIDQARQAEMASQGEAAQAEGQAFRDENAAKEGVTTTESGLQYEVLEPGDGATPEADDRVTIHYRGTHIDGTEFDSSYGGDPATFAVGGVIPGFSEGLQLMQVGSKYRFVIPGNLAYGPNGNGRDIGPNETLVFEVELLGIDE